MSSSIDYDFTPGTAVYVITEPTNPRNGNLIIPGGIVPGIVEMVKGTVYNQVSSPIESVTITAGGTGYTTALIAFSGGGGGGFATANAIIFNGSIVGVQLVNPGSGYTFPPVIIITGDGTGAAGTATVTIGEVTQVTYYVSASNNASLASTTSLPSPGPNTQILQIDASKVFGNLTDAIAAYQAQL